MKFIQGWKLIVRQRRWDLIQAFCKLKNFSRTITGTSMILKLVTLKNRGTTSISEDQTRQSARDHQIIPKRLESSKGETQKG